MADAGARRGAAPLVVTMGVSGSGKTLIGSALARALGLDYVDGDALHAPASIAKMRAGTPLTDADRQPWLERVAAWLRAHRARGGVVSCSALRRAYRDVLMQAAPELVFAHLAGDAALLAARLTQRTEHFMPASLLASQLAILEPLAPDERGVVLDVRDAPEDILAKLRLWLDAAADAQPRM